MAVVPRFAAAVSTATEAVAPILRPEPGRRPRDTLVHIDREQEEATEAPQRKVA